MNTGIYIASSYKDHAIASKFAEEMRQAGVVVQSTWHDGVTAEMVNDNWRHHGDAADHKASLRAVAEIGRATALVIVGNSNSTGGGLHFEAGFAIGIKKPVIRATREFAVDTNPFLASSVFATDAGVYVVDDPESFKKVLGVVLAFLVAYEVR